MVYCYAAGLLTADVEKYPAIPRGQGCDAQYVACSRRYLGDRVVLWGRVGPHLGVEVGVGNLFVRISRFEVRTHTVVS